MHGSGEAALREWGEVVSGGNVASLLNAMLSADVSALLDKVDGPPESERALSRERTEQIIHAALWAHGVRGGSFASCFAFEALQEAVKP